MKQKGFSLIELMIVVVIIGILASIAVPSYQKYVIRASRIDGMTTLLNIMRAQENLYANEFTYTTDLTELNFNAIQLSSSGHYKITASLCGTDLINECVQLTASGLGNQANDGILTLNSRGERKHGSNIGWDN